jgi:hypothetical protein
MTGTTERQMCRNPRCRSRLPAPVSNPREAFCARGCHTQFYRRRCIACEQPMERKRESQQLCGRRKCEGQFKILKAYRMLGRYHPSSAAVDASRNPTKPGTFSRLKTDRGWRQGGSRGELFPFVSDAAGVAIARQAPMRCCITPTRRRAGRERTEAARCPCRCVYPSVCSVGPSSAPILEKFIIMLGVATPA